MQTEDTVANAPVTSASTYELLAVLKGIPFLHSLKAGILLLDGDRPPEPLKGTEGWTVILAINLFWYVLRIKIEHYQGTGLPLRSTWYI